MDSFIPIVNQNHESAKFLRKMQRDRLRNMLVRVAAAVLEGAIALGVLWWLANLGV